MRRTLDITRRDIYNVASKLSVRVSEDADILLRRIRELQREDPDWVVEPVTDDATGELKALFWMSPLQVQLARRFHHVLLHNNTYRSNRFGMPLGIFAGVDNHGMTVLMAQCLMYAEGTPDYDWAFRCWMHAVGHVPSVIFSDADLSVEASLPAVFPTSVAHFWCIWHVVKNIYKKLCSETWGTLQRVSIRLLQSTRCAMVANTL